MKRRIVFLAGLSIVLGWVAVGGLLGLFGRPVHAEVADTGHGAAPGTVTIPLFSSGCTVTSTLDSGPGSLRACMAQLGAGDVITFDTAIFPPGDPQTITLNSELPTIVTDTVTIDGSDAGVILNGGSDLPGDGIGLVIDGANNVVIKGLQILNFPGDGIVLQNGASNNTIGGTNGSPGGSCSGDCNLISGNQIGVVMKDSDTMYNTVSGNYIGTNVNGTEALGNRVNGVGIREGAQYNLIGGDTASQRNLISGNGHGGGVVIIDSGTMYNTISGNYIGTNVSGTAALENGGNGVYIGSGAQDNVIGGNTPEERNVISGNDTVDVEINGIGTMHNTVSGNYIGTNASGTAAIGNAGGGVWIWEGAQYNLIGGDTAGERNIISGHGEIGVSIASSGTMHNTASGNYIGTNASGTAALGNGGHGVNIGMGAQYNVIGGDTEGERNLISGNGRRGVNIRHSSTMSNTVSGNYIGTNASGTEAIGNAESGVSISSGAQYNVIGGDTEGERNLISGNGLNGVRILGSDTTSNTVSGNYIGTNVSGTEALSNTQHGVFIGDGTQYNVIGGDKDGERNLISGNSNYGVFIWGIGTMHNTVSGNYVGTDASGTAALGNGDHGVNIGMGAQYNLIGGSNASPGGSCTGDCNLISGNGRRGVMIADDGTMYNTVSGNYIGMNASGTEAIGNTESGVKISIGRYNLIGGDTPGERNVISGNGKRGVMIADGTMYNIVSGNYIGMDAAGTSGLGNDSDGVLLGEGQKNTIGPTNTIGYNGRFGVLVVGEGGVICLHNTITRNSIYSNTRRGIGLYYGGNTELPPPMITTVDPSLGLVSGTACALCTVEVFSDNEDEGQIFEGSTTADGSGNFTFNKADGFTLSNVTATATDVDGNTSEFSNVPPTVGAIIGPVDPLQVGTVVNVIADFTDPNSEDTHTATWDWGDESTSDGTVANYTVSGSHTYDTPGVYTIELTVTDNNGGVGSAVYQFVVVYDPEGGFVTGGGWIDSPPGAYVDDLSLTGKATFGFVAKYKKGADTPTGQTEFRFRVADLNFHSEVYQWLVVAGPKAQFKGDGTINGAGNYGFMLTAIDAELTPSTEVDLFRIKIWDKDNGDTIVYDNQMNATDDAEPTTVLGGGSIVIHEAK